MLDVNDLVEGVTKVKMITKPSFSEEHLAGVGTFMKYDDSLGSIYHIGVSFGKEQVGGGLRGLYWFTPNELVVVKDKVNQESDTTSQSEDLIIYKSRWDEIIESLEGGSNGVAGMTEEEAEVVKSVLKNNVPFNVVEISDPIIEKEEQTHLDATHIGDTGNCALYYKSELLKKWFWWGEDYTWEECNFDYRDGQDLFPITISK